MRNTNWRSLVVVAALLTAGAARAKAQAQPAANVRALEPTGARAEAVAHYETGLDANLVGNFAAAARHLRMALDSDSGFGLARSELALITGGRPSIAQHDRAVADAAKGSAGEALMALAQREGAAGRGANARAIWDALAQMYPDDRRIALKRALSRTDTARLNLLRELARRAPEYAPAHAYLAVSLVPSAILTYDQTVADEALAAADAGLRAQPEGASLLGVRGYVAERLLRHDEAMQYLDRSSAAEPIDWVYYTKAEIASRDRKVTLARAYLDSAITVSQSLPRRVGMRVTQALLRVEEGAIGDAVAGLRSIAQQAETDNLPGAAANAHAVTSFLYAAMGDTAAVGRELADAARLGESRADLAFWRIYAAALTGMGTTATEQLAAYVDEARNPDSGIKPEYVHSATGLAALANGKYEEAIAHLKQGGADPENELATIEALTKLGRKKEAAAARDSLLARKNMDVSFVEVPVAIYRSTMKRK
ncbi:hypothetical protein J421_3102 [Gemmatirosa kalamazoonensis]|uniref:Tetratricopeptide repeat protein n=1 Tax=Gemmatirosa kalamazoonensis TaxID=861299 RepID=W0RHP9_9BACT|nr:hypothetical protein [Gemmatirosa kalamazoonensis]AHG90639.1 hypothetical protein J421_3102 [Gemmatirosa kalamazoonensis]